MWNDNKRKLCVGFHSCFVRSFLHSFLFAYKPFFFYFVFSFFLFFLKTFLIAFDLSISDAFFSLSVGKVWRMVEFRGKSVCVCLNFNSIEISIHHVRWAGTCSDTKKRQCYECKIICVYAIIWYVHYMRLDRFLFCVVVFGDFSLFLHFVRCLVHCASMTWTKVTDISHQKYEYL